MKKRVSIKDIATLAGVSIGTVDRVLHNRGEVNTETRNRIMQIINELGYTPNLQAKALSMKKSLRFAVIIPDSQDNNPYWQKPMDGINLAIAELSNYNTNFSIFHFDASSEQSFITILASVPTNEIDGVLLCPVFKQAALQFIHTLNSQQIPFVFIDININNAGNIGYFGQDAYQSGVIAARLMQKDLQTNRNVLIVKQSNHKIFSNHIEQRVSGFRNSIGNDYNIAELEIDLSDPQEPDASLLQTLKKQQFNGIFVPNTRAFRFANFASAQGINNLCVIGYDLIDENINHLKKGNISYLLNQRPDEQSYKAIMLLFNYLLGQKEINQIDNYSPIDIIIKENVEYYSHANWTNK